MGRELFLMRYILRRKKYLQHYLFELHRQSEPLNSASFSPDGKFVLTAGWDKLAIIYDCEACGSIDELLALAQRRVTRVLTQEEKQRYLAAP